MVRVCDVGATDDGQHVRKASLCSLLLSGMLRVIRERTVLLPCCDAQILANRNNTLVSEISSNLSKGCLGQGGGGGVISESTPLCTIPCWLRDSVCAGAADQHRGYLFYNLYLCSPCARHQAELLELREKNRHS